MKDSTGQFIIEQFESNTMSCSINARKILINLKSKYEIQNFHICIASLYTKTDNKTEALCNNKNELNITKEFQQLTGITITEIVHLII